MLLMVIIMKKEISIINAIMLHKYSIMANITSRIKKLKIIAFLCEKLQNGTVIQPHSIIHSRVMIGRQD